MEKIYIVPYSSVSFITFGSTDDLLRVEE